MATASPRETVRALLAEAVAGLAGEWGFAAPVQVAMERTKRPEHGDFASNVAMTLTKVAGKPPLAIADAIVDRLARLPAGRGALVAEASHAAVGDALARLLRFAGYPVTCEFYVNDAGNQVQMLALSVWVRYMETARAADPSVPAVSFPDNGYKGAYIRDFGRGLFARDGARWVGTAPPADIGPVKAFAIDRALTMIKATLVAFDVTFDVWQSERALHAAGDVAGTLAALETAGFIDRHDDAVWLRTTALWNDEQMTRLEENITKEDD